MYLRNLDKHGRDAEKNLDLRIRKTRRAIRSGLVKACEAKPLRACERRRYLPCVDGLAHDLL